MARRIKKRPAHRPTGYRAEFCRTVVPLYEGGATDIEVADVLGVSSRTMYRWQASYPQFRQATAMGKAVADDRVERSLYHRAVGYSYDAVKIMQDKGVPVIVPYREHVPPDVSAALTWLKNRRPDAWRDRHELTGPDGQPIEVRTVVEFVNVTSSTSE